MAPVPTIGTTAIVIELPAAEVLLEAVAGVDPSLVRTGLPAHVTVLYPFVAAADVDDETERAVRRLAGSMPAVDLLLRRLVAAPGFVAVEAAELDPVITAFRDRWPAVRPYGGRFGESPTAHVTMALGCDEAEARRVGDRVGELLPLRARAEAVHLVVLTDRGWRRRVSAPFA
ncbi:MULTISPECIES: 2'-5' RNA ligase family protein [unclassified Streptomyces]|uniref:2'-5' RNA ligase family protein n=1 Tax=unclassified Streptomyces TaxID=2593676 RepID=UPI0036605BB5